MAVACSHFLKEFCTDFTNNILFLFENPRLGVVRIFLTVFLVSNSSDSLAFASLFKLGLGLENSLLKEIG